MLGALPPTNVSVIKDRIVTTASDPAKVQTFATQTNQVIDPTKGSTFTDKKLDYNYTPETNSSDIMDTLKKYAPYIIGAVVLYYVIKNK